MAKEKKGLKKKVMKNKGKFATNRANLVREKSNLRHVLQSSGEKAAQAYVALKLAQGKPLGSYLARLLNIRNVKRQA